ncbi:MAG: tRNA pseudouridine(38-40) synthase TruA [Chlamydiota bacterium]
MKNIQLIIAYDGTGFLGWQKTPLGSTVEETLETVLSQILQEKIHLQAASRTDANVHAEGQSINFFTNKDRIPLSKLLQGINALLPPSIAALSIEEKPFPFHPTLDSQGKEYQYFICNTPYQQPKHRFFSWHVKSPLQIDLMKEASKHLLGTHDFSAFCNQRSLLDKDPTCTLYSIKIDLLENDRIKFSIIGNRFLYRMMRNLVGTLAYIGQGKITPEEVKEILLQKKRALAGITAPAHGLHLIQVFYKKMEDSILYSN